MHTLFNPGVDLPKNLEKMRIFYKKSTKEFVEILELSLKDYSTLMLKNNDTQLNPVLLKKLAKKLDLPLPFIELSAVNKNMIKLQPLAFQLMKDTICEIYKLEIQIRNK